jgi:ornithine carbamoyltransferase
VEALARHSGIPVYNGLTDLYHPTQVLADLLTLREARGKLDGARLAYVGDGRNNVARSLMIGCALTGVEFALGTPAELAPEPELIERCRAIAARETGGITVVHDAEEAVRGAHAVYTDVWASMGEESRAAERERLLRAFQVTESLMAATGDQESVFLHCLPAVKGKEVTEAVFEGPASRVFEQAENRKHTIKAVILATLGREAG